MFNKKKNKIKELEIKYNKLDLCYKVLEKIFTETTGKFPPKIEGNEDKQILDICHHVKQDAGIEVEDE